MNSDILIKTLKFLHSKISEVQNNYYLNERINDWYEIDKSSYGILKNDLGHISHSLKEQSMLTAAKLFDGDPDSLSIQSVSNFINSNKILDKQNDLKLKELAKNIDTLISDNKDELSNLRTFRDNYLAHFDKKLRNTNSNIFLLKLDSAKIIALLENIFDLMNNMFELLGHDKISSCHNTFGNSIDILFEDYQFGYLTRKSLDTEKLVSILQSIKRP